MLARPGEKVGERAWRIRGGGQRPVARRRHGGAAHLGLAAVGEGKCLLAHSEAIKHWENHVPRPERGKSSDLVAG
jgi:hypothetical protein